MLKAKRFFDFIITKRRDTQTKIEEDITFFNEKTLAYSLSNIPQNQTGDIHLTTC